MQSTSYFQIISTASQNDQIKIIALKLSLMIKQN
jgi:hypothetical protein